MAAYLSLRTRMVHTGRCSTVSRTLRRLNGEDSRHFYEIPMGVALDYADRAVYRDCKTCARRRDAESGA